MIRVLLADDEQPAREELRFLLRACADVEIVGEAAGGVAALEQTLALSPDLVFLDIQMPEVSGLDVAEQLLAVAPAPPLIVFVTAYDAYAIRAFELSAADYLLKPMATERLDRCLERVRRRLAARPDEIRENLQEALEALNARRTFERITVYREERFYPLNLDELIFATAHGKTTTLCTTRGDFTWPGTLGHLAERLPSDNFFRTHRSYLVNLRHISEIELWFGGTYQLRLAGTDEVVPVSRGQAREFKRLMGMA